MGRRACLGDMAWSLHSYTINVCFSLQDQASKNSGINGAGVLQVPSLPEEFSAGVGCWGLQVPFLPEELLAGVDCWEWRSISLYKFVATADFHDAVDGSAPKGIWEH